MGTQRGLSLLCTFSFEFSDDTLADACQTADLADACTKMLHLYDHAVPFFLGKMLKGDGTVNPESRYHEIAYFIVTDPFCSIIAIIENIQGFGQHLVYQAAQFLRREPADNVLRGTNGKGTSHVFLVFAPTSPRVFPNLGNDSRCNRILMNISQQGGEVGHIIHWLTLKTALKQMSEMVVTFVVILCIRVGNAADRPGDALTGIAYQQMYMIGH